MPNDVKPCEWCGQEFELIGVQTNAKKYCCVACKRLGNLETKRRWRKAHPGRNNLRKVNPMLERNIPKWVRPETKDDYNHGDILKLSPEKLVRVVDDILVGSLGYASRT